MKRTLEIQVGKLGLRDLFDDRDVSVSDFEAIIQEFKAGGATYLRYDFDVDSDNCIENNELVGYYTCEESDEEYRSRIKEEGTLYQKLQQDQDEKDYQQYLQLKERFKDK